MNDRSEKSGRGPQVLPIGGQARGRKNKGGGCALCGKPVDPAYRPFCSKRCADVDLHRWLSGSYRVPTEERPEEGEIAPGDDEDGA